MQCPDCLRHSRHRPCEVVDHIPGRKGRRPVWVLRCQYCSSVFPYTSPPNFWRMLRTRGVPREVVRDLQRSLWQHIFSVTARPHTEEEVKVAIERLNERVQRIGGLVFVDGILYRKDAKTMIMPNPRRGRGGNLPEPERDGIASRMLARGYDPTIAYELTQEGVSELKRRLNEQELKEKNFSVDFISMVLGRLKKKQLPVLFNDLPKDPARVMELNIERLKKEWKKLTDVLGSIENQIELFMNCENSEDQLANLENIKAPIEEKLKQKLEEINRLLKASQVIEGNSIGKASQVLEGNRMLKASQGYRGNRKKEASQIKEGNRC